MRHWTDEELMLHYYCEAEGDRDHLDSCADCQERMRQLEAALALASDLKVPDRPAEYGWQVWQRVEPQLTPRRRATVIPWPRWIAVGALAASLIVAFYLGRHSRPEPETYALRPEVRERLLNAALADHLDRSQRVLMELVNSRGGDASLDTATIEDVVAANRLYRLAAQRQGDQRTVAVLEDLERLLVEAANGAPGEADTLKRRVDDTELLFRVRTVRERAKTSLPSGTF